MLVFAFLWPALWLPPCTSIATAASQISGHITDPSGGVVSGVTVRLIGTTGGAVGNTTSDSNGDFDFNSIPDGKYTVAAERPGFDSLGVTVTVVGRSILVFLQFRKLSTRQQSVTVTATVPALAPDDSARTFSRDEVLGANPGRPGAPISIPGLPIETASGGIKAPQYFAPGVAGDHGEPIGQFFQVGSFLFPNNLPANAHGNGYSDPNVLIAPVIGDVQADGGAFNVREGDHSVDLAATYDMRPRLNSFAQVTVDYRDVDFVTGWSPQNPSRKEWLALEASFGNGLLERLEHRHQYKMDGYRDFKAGRHDISLLGTAYYGFSRIPGLIPIGVPVPNETVDYRQLDRTHNFLAVASDTWQLNASSQFLFAGFMRDYDLTLQSNFGDGLIQQRENRTVGGGEGAYLTQLGHGLSLLAGVDLRRDAPRNLDLKHFNEDLGLFQLVTSNNFTFSFAEPFVSLDGSLGRHIHFNLGTRQEEININNQDLLTPSNSFNKRISMNMPKATVTFLPSPDSPLPSLSLSAAEAFHTDDPRISTDPGATGPPNLITTSRAYRATLKKDLGRTEMRLVLIHVANSEETVNIDPDTGLQQYVGPSLNHALTASVTRNLGPGSVEVSFSKADARDRITGQPVPEAPRLIWDAVGHYDRLPLGLRALGEFEYVGAKPLGDGFTGVRNREIRGSLHKSFGEGRMDAALSFLLASGYSGQTLETLALPMDPAPFERITGVPLKSYVSLSWTYNFGR
jgi:Carboxypeptidase regulatory-like domain